MQKTAITVITVVLSFSARAEWTYRGATERADYYMDFSTIKKTPNGYRAWEMYDYRTPGIKGNLSFKSLSEYDCQEERFRVLSDTFYSGHKGSGAITGGNSNPSPWEYVIPESIAETMLKEVCLFGQHPLPPGYKPAPAPPPGFTETLPPK